MKRNHRSAEKEKVVGLGRCGPWQKAGTTIPTHGVIASNTLRISPFLWEQSLSPSINGNNPGTHFKLDLLG